MKKRIGLAVALLATCVAAAPASADDFHSNRRGSVSEREFRHENSGHNNVAPRLHRFERRTDRAMQRHVVEPVSRGLHRLGRAL